MRTILEIQPPSTSSFFPQLGPQALPDPTPLVLPHPPVPRLGGGTNIVRPIFPTTPGVQDLQDPIQHLSLIGTGPTGLRRTWEEPLEIGPLPIGQIGLIRFAWPVR